MQKRFTAELRAIPIKIIIIIDKTVLMIYHEKRI